MQNIIFSTICCVFAVIYTIYIVISSETVSLSTILFLLIVILAGLSFIIKKLKKIILDHKTEKFGEDSYAYIKNIYPKENNTNSRPLYQGYFIVYIPSKNKTEKITEKVGYDALKYQIGTFVKVKYYNGDINIKEVTDYNALPLNVRPYFDQLISSPNDTTNQ